MQTAKNVTWKVVSYGAGMLAAFTTRKVLAKVWGRVGDEPHPDDVANRRVPWSQAVVWAVATGVGMGVTRLIAMRSAAAVWEAATNEAPPGEDLEG
jgi:hypothetical protein